VVAATAALAAHPLFAAGPAAPAMPSQMPTLLALFIAAVAVITAAGGQLLAFQAARRHARAQDRRFEQFGHALTQAAREIAALSAVQSGAAREARAQADGAAAAAARSGTTVADAEMRLTRFVQRAEQNLTAAADSVVRAADTVTPLAALAADLPRAVEAAVQSASQAVAHEAAARIAAAPPGDDTPVQPPESALLAASIDAVGSLLARAAETLATLEGAVRAATAAAPEAAAALQAPIERLEAAAAGWEARAGEIDARTATPDGAGLAAAAAAATEALHAAQLWLDAQQSAPPAQTDFGPVLDRLETLAANWNAALAAQPDQAALAEATSSAVAMLDRVSAVSAPLCDVWPALARAALHGTETLRQQADDAGRMATACQHHTAALLNACAQIASTSAALPAMIADMSAAREQPAIAAAPFDADMIVQQNESRAQLHAVLSTLQDSAALIAAAAAAAADSAASQAAAAGAQLQGRIETVLAPAAAIAAALADRLSQMLDAAGAHRAAPAIDWAAFTETFIETFNVSLQAAAATIAHTAETRLAIAIDRVMPGFTDLQPPIANRFDAATHHMEHAASDLRAEAADALAAARHIIAVQSETADRQADLAARIGAVLSERDTAPRADLFACWRNVLADTIRPIGIAIDHVIAKSAAQDHASTRVLDAIQNVQLALAAAQSAESLHSEHVSTRIRHLAETARALRADTESMALAMHAGNSSLPRAEMLRVPDLLQEIGGAIAQLQNAATALALAGDLAVAA
jgi:hypothetical protein